LFQMQKKLGMLNEGRNSLPNEIWGRLLRVNLLNKITTIYSIFEGFFLFHPKFRHVLVYYVLKKFLKLDGCEICD
jgi:hypothetical protein